MPKKLDPDYEPPTDEQIWEAIETAKKTFREHDQRLREKLSQIVPGFDSVDNRSWIDLACSLTKHWGGDTSEWVDMPLPDLLAYVDKTVRSELANWTDFQSLQVVATYLKDRGRIITKTGVDSWLRRGKPWIVRYGELVYLDLNHSYFDDLKK